MKRFSKSFFVFNNTRFPQTAILRQCDNLRCNTTLVLNMKNDNDDLINSYIQKFEASVKDLKNDGSLELLLDAYRLGHYDGYNLVAEEPTLVATNDKPCKFYAFK